MAHQISTPPSPGIRTSRCAIVSLVVSVLSFLVGMLGVLTGLTGMILGYVALRHMSRNSRLSGDRIALSGLLCGALAVSFSITIFDWNSLISDPSEKKSHLSGPVGIW